MLTPKIIYYTHKTYADGSHPIMLQVVKEGKAIRKVIGKCKPNEWLASKSRVNAKNVRYIAINDDIDAALKNYGRKNDQSFKDYYNQYIKQLKENQNVALHELNTKLLEDLLTFKPDLDFEDIDNDFILNFVNTLKPRNGANSIKVKMQSLSKFLNMAKKAKLIDANPIDGILFKKEKTVKQKLLREEIAQFINSKVEGKMALMRDVFLASIYMRGARVGDVLKLTKNNIQKGRLIYIEQKTGNIKNIELPVELTEIFERNQNKSRHGYIFNILDIPEKYLNDKFVRRKAINKATVLVNYYLKKIALILEIPKNVSPHTARHSYSRLARSVIKDTSITKDLIGHSSLAVHEGYIGEIEDNEVMDGYSRLVLDTIK